MDCDEKKTISDKMLCLGIDVKKYQLEKPYPEVSVNRKDRKYLPLIYNDYASRNSEYTAISQYIYGHFTTDEDKNPIYKEIADAFLGIAMVEMFHLEFLSDVIVGVEAEPRFVNYKKNVWKSSFVPYGLNVKDSLKLAITAENEAIKQYEEHIRLIGNRSIRELLKRIVKDEELHLKIFSDLLENLE